MPPKIEISDELYAKLEKYAVGFDTPASVIERFVEAHEHAQAGGAAGSSRGPQILPKDTRSLIEFALQSHFNVIPRPFGQKAGTWFGASDDNEGVQWNIGYNMETGETLLGVNLEGMKYGGRWPITKFLLRELEAPELPNYSTTQGAEAITVRLVRDAWQASARPQIEEKEIEGSGTALSNLTPELWNAMVKEGLDCLNPLADYMGRGKTIVTLTKSGEKVEREVSPHLTIRTPLWATKPTHIDDMLDRLSSAQRRLQPLHDFVKIRSES